MIIFPSTLSANNDHLRHLAHYRRGKNLPALPVNLTIDAVQYFLFILPLRQAQGEDKWSAQGEDKAGAWGEDRVSAQIILAAKILPRGIAQSEDKWVANHKSAENGRAACHDGDKDKIAVCHESMGVACYESKELIDYKGKEREYCLLLTPRIKFYRHSRQSRNIFALFVKKLTGAFQYFLFILTLCPQFALASRSQFILTLSLLKGESGVGGHQYFFFIFTLRSPLILTLRSPLILTLRPQFILILSTPLILILSLSKDESKAGKRQELSKFTIGK